LYRSLDKVFIRILSGLHFKFSALFEFLVSGYELSRTGTMQEWTMPVSLMPFRLKR
jgi:hypothetical protein